MDQQGFEGGSVVGGRRGRIRRLAPFVAVSIVSALAPMIVLAAQFSDVPPSNTFYQNIENVANAGITSGCGGGKYCPKDYVTREQMAAFLNRAAPRANSVSFGTPLGNNPSGTAADGGIVAQINDVRSLKNELLLLSSTLFAFTYPTAGTFPCEQLYRFQVDGVNVGAAIMYDRASVQPVGTWVTKNIAGESIVGVGPGIHTVRLVYNHVSGTCSNFPGNGSLTAQVIPFRADMTSIP